jgi:ABC-type glycerol-3-phosphate transport system substrate-binding protein
VIRDKESFMRLSVRSFWTMVVVVLFIGAAVPMAVLQSQSDSIVLSLVVPDYVKDVFSDKLINDFESANPGVKIHLVSDAQGYGPPAAQGLDEHLDQLGKYVQAGDVLMVGTQSLSPATVAAGYYLDLSPLASGDKNLNTEDFQTSVWQSFQWDKGIWALPVATSVWIMTYDPAAFDKAGLPYPTDKWTLDDLANAARKLTVKDADGKITTPGLGGLYPGYNGGMLVRSLTGETLYDDSTLPATPKFNKPAIEAFLKPWSDFQTDVLSNGPNGGNPDQAPISITQQYALMFQPDPNVKHVGVMLPGGKAGLDVQGFAVSGGTLHPEQAYALARFLTTRPELTNRLGAIPARKSLIGAKPDDQSFMPKITPEVQAIIDQALANSIPMSETRFMDYLDKAVQQMQKDKVDAKTALQTVETQAVKDQQTAAEKKTASKIAVATPIPTAILNAGEVSLSFALGAFQSPLPNKDRWDSLIKDFTANDPQVKQIILDPGFNFGDLKKTAEKYDCFYLPYNVVADQNLSSLLSLDPFLAADKSFDKADMVGMTLDQVTKDNKVWGLPIVVTPSILKYNSEVFSKGGVQAPTNDWTVDKFKDTLQTLKTDPKADPPFVMQGGNGTPLLILIAAYGGLLLDFRTSPPTINYTDPATITAIKQVLDLARQGYIKYQELGSLTGGGGGSFGPDIPIYSDILSAYTFFSGGGGGPGQDPYKPVSYPHGTQFTGIAYGVGSAYISANSKNPEACYRWISAISKHSELFSGMPARRSLINDPALIASQSKEAVDMYNAIDAKLKDPNTLSFPDQFGGSGTEPTGYLLQHWLYQAFDSYVLKNGDLDSALKDAESYSKGFQDCAKSLPPYDPSSTDNAKEYFKAFGACATKIDSRLSAMFASIQ